MPTVTQPPSHTPGPPLSHHHHWSYHLFHFLARWVHICPPCHVRAFLVAWPTDKASHKPLEHILFLLWLALSHIQTHHRRLIISSPFLPSLPLQLFMSHLNPRCLIITLPALSRAFNLTEVMNLLCVSIQKTELIEYQHQPELLQGKTFVSIMKSMKPFIFWCLLLQVKKDFLHGVSWWGSWSSGFY